MQDKPGIEEVLEHYKVSSNGRRLVHCPFHEDRQPSCSIKYDQNLFNCFSCGRCGDSWTLIMEMEGVEFVTAVALARKYGLSFGDDEPHGNPRRASRPGRRSPRGSYRPRYAKGD